jgi:hypothetical protein
MPRILFVVVGPLALTLLTDARAQVIYQAPYGAGDTWNLYELGDIELTWAEALEEAQNSTRMGVTGDLASIHSIEENRTVHFVGGGQSVWIGLTDREGAAPPLDQNGAISPQESLGLNLTPANSKLQGWAWTSGEPFTYHNWNGGEPNNGTRDEFGNEDAVHLWPGGDWNDAASGYFEEEPIEATLQELTSADESAGGVLPFVIEYRTQAATPFDDIPIYEPPPPPEVPTNAIATGIDTLLAESATGQLGPDATHGHLQDWEWDGEDGGGQNHGLLWFDIPQSTLDRFGDGTATLRLEVSNEGSNADVHRVTVDWLSEPDGGDDITWNNMPNGPGLFAGDNVHEDFSFSTQDLPVGEIEFDVTEDVLAWAAGEPNYGWGFIPTGTNGVGIRSFETDRPPLLLLELELGEVIGDFDGSGMLDAADIDDLTRQAAAGTNPPSYDLSGDSQVNEEDVRAWVKDLYGSWIGDANLDLEFNSGDLVSVLASGTYENNVDAVWSTGDFNGDGRTSSADLVAALADGGYEQGPRPAVNAVPEPVSLTMLIAGLVGQVTVSQVRRRTVDRKLT